MPGRQELEPSVMNPANPTPGTEDMTGYLYQAFATDINDRMRDNGNKDLRALVTVEDINLPEIAGFTSPNEMPAPDMEPLRVREDDRVRVTATLCPITRRSGGPLPTTSIRMRGRWSFPATRRPAKIW